MTCPKLTVHFLLNSSNLFFNSLWHIY